MTEECAFALHKLPHSSPVIFSSTLTTSPSLYNDQWGEPGHGWSNWHSVYITTCRNPSVTLHLDFIAVLLAVFLTERTCWWSEFAVFCIQFSIFFYSYMLSCCFPHFPFLLFTATDCDVSACVHIPCSWLQKNHVLDVSFHNTNVLVTTPFPPSFNTQHLPFVMFGVFCWMTNSE